MRKLLKKMKHTKSKGNENCCKCTVHKHAIIENNNTEKKHKVKHRQK